MFELFEGLYISKLGILLVLLMAESVWGFIIYQVIKSNWMRKNNE
jgi:hypothetical protein